MSNVSEASGVILKQVSRCDKTPLWPDSLWIKTTGHSCFGQHAELRAHQLSAHTCPCGDVTLSPGLAPGEENLGENSSFISGHLIVTLNICFTPLLKFPTSWISILHISFSCISFSQATPSWPPGSLQSNVCALLLLK